jgi:hypothetical protein
VVAAREAIVRAFDHAPLTVIATNQYVDYGAGDRRRLQAMLRFAEIAT